MTTKSYSKHKEYKEISSRGTVPYTDEQFDMMKSELLPKGSKLDSLGRGTGTREYHYEYKEEKLPGGKYDRKDYHTVEEYTIPARSLPKSSESSSYYYEKEERDIPAITTGTRTYNYETTGTSPGYSKVNTKVTKEMSQNVEELDSLLDDLQKDQERQLYKSGYTSDTAESSSFDYRRGTPVKAPPSSGYSTLKHEERVESSSWGSSPAPAPTLTRAAELRQQMYREEKTESRVVPAVVPAPVALPVPPAVCTHCHQSPGSTGTVKSRVVPAVVPAPVALPVPPAVCTHCHQSPGTTGTLPRGGTPMNKVTTTVKTYTYEVPADTDPASVPIPTHADTHTYVCNDTHRTATLTRPVDGSPAPGGCQYCSHCNSRLHYSRTHLSTDEHTTTNERMVYPSPANEPHVTHASHGPTEPHNGHGPYGPTTYKYSETSYSSHNSTLSPPPHAPHTPHRHPSPSPASSPAPFPRPHTPSPAEQQPPKRLDDLLADFPEAAMQGGGAYASGRGMYEYESGARSKEKHYEKKTAVPVCLPLCCAMPCVIL
ncbi:hypothetical protein RR46_01030 [Papilio xuthus]|uniref:Uncharacterized protein n=1 Tax=Papilio xuthus TaxID=66420 RepID=A0A0N1PHI1_PAPXU|nr:hypothetical protein RR46_01030 [Papilio xuthus]